MPGHQQFQVQLDHLKTPQYLDAALEIGPPKSKDSATNKGEGEIRTLVLRALIASYLVILWVDQVFYVSIDAKSLRPSDLLLAVATIATLALRPWAVFQVLRSRPTQWCIALFAALLLSTLVHEGSHVVSQGATVMRPTLRTSLQFSLLLVFATVAMRDARWFGRYVYSFAAVVVVVAGLGAIAALALKAGDIQWAPRTPAFFVQDQHPLFGDWPRPVGGFSLAAEKFGFWAMVACAVLVAGAARSFERPRLVLVVVGALVAAATVTVSASGGLLFIPVVLHYRGYRRAAYWLAAPIILLLLVAQIPVHLATPPSGVKARTSNFECTEHFQDHLARSKSQEDSLCHLLPAPQDTVLTRYGLARVHAWQVWTRSPLLGEGVASFKRQAAAAKDGASRPIIWAYRSPHSAIAGTAAEQGLLGLALFLAFGIALVLAGRGATKILPDHALAVNLALAGFAAAAISQDAHRERLFWIVCGYALGLALKRRSPGSRS